MADFFEKKKKKNVFQRELQGLEMEEDGIYLQRGHSEKEEKTGKVTSGIHVLILSVNHLNIPTEPHVYTNAKL